MPKTVHLILKCLKRFIEWPKNWIPAKRSCPYADWVIKTGIKSYDQIDKPTQKWI